MGQQLALHLAEEEERSRTTVSIARVDRHIYTHTHTHTLHNTHAYNIHVIMDKTIFCSILHFYLIRTYAHSNV